MDEVHTHLGLIRFRLLFGSCRTLKDRRGHLSSLQDRLRNMGFAVAQVGPADLVQSAWVSACCVSGRESVVREMLDSAERMVLDNPSLEPLDIQMDIYSTEEP